MIRMKRDDRVWAAYLVLLLGVSCAEKTERQSGSGNGKLSIVNEVEADASQFYSDLALEEDSAYDAEVCESAVPEEIQFGLKPCKVDSVVIQGDSFRDCLEGRWVDAKIGCADQDWSGDVVYTVKCSNCKRSMVRITKNMRISCQVGQTKSVYLEGGGEIESVTCVAKVPESKTPTRGDPKVLDACQRGCDKRL